ncbi:beta-galactosidase [Babesia caballi]|uniref:Beta-galactosidase n=1 Tax=Babesia caballi TaxID=5871 RepID=A0AAV4LYM3_BABCB|nr:beta-galactosidase [Babesia caballi]GIX64923.1 beta-galactosidase [Babesia caballi]
MRDAEGRGGSRVSSGTETSAVSATTPTTWLATEAKVMLDGCEVGTEVRGRVYKGNDNARTGGIPQFHAATDRTVEERLGDLGRSTALDEAKVAGVHISTQIGGEALGERCDMGVQRFARWRLGQCG